MSVILSNYNKNKPKPKKGSAVRGAGIARQGVRKSKII